MDLKEEDILGDQIGTHWYYVAKGRAMRSLLGGGRVDEVLDVGAGSGVFTRQLLDAGLAERGTCVDPNYEIERTEDHNGHAIAFVRALDRVTQQLVVMMDVLEHVDDDLALLKHYTDAMPQGGRVLITVPAFQSLWSGHDDFLEHKRRYTLPQVEDLVRAAGLNVVTGRYFFGALFPVAATLRLADRFSKLKAKSHLKAAPPLLNSALIAVHDVERALLFPFNRLAGLTVFCLAERRD